MIQGLHGNTAFDAEIQSVIEKTALFLVLHSHNYQGSEYCRKELGWFMDHNRRYRNGIMVGNESRLFNVLISNIPHQHWPDELAGIVGFKLHDAPEKTERFGYPLGMQEAAFDKSMRQLVEAATQTMDALRQQAPAPVTLPDMVPSNDLPKIFLADVADTLQPFRKRLINEIGDFVDQHYLMHDAVNLRVSRNPLETQKALRQEQYIKETRAHYRDASILAVVYPKCAEDFGSNQPMWASVAGDDQYGRYADLVVKGITQKFRWIEPGTFWMGSPESEPERISDEIRHQVTLTKGFWLAIQLVPKLCGKRYWVIIPLHFKNNANNPVEQVSWDDAQKFLQTLNSTYLA